MGYSPVLHFDRVRCIVDLMACRDIQLHFLNGHTNFLQLFLHRLAWCLQHLDRSYSPTWCRPHPHSWDQGDHGDPQALLLPSLLALLVLPSAPLDWDQEAPQDPEDQSVHLCRPFQEVPVVQEGPHAHPDHQLLYKRG